MEAIGEQGIVLRMGQLEQQRGAENILFNTL